MDKDTKFRLMEAASYYLEDCGSCGACHPVDFHGDCRDDINRIGAPEDLVAMWESAPELLEACKDALRALDAIKLDMLTEDCPGVVTHDQANAIDQLHEAIAKAEA